MRKSKVEETPKLYLSTYQGKWTTIYQGMPCCKSFDSIENPLKVYHMTREELHWDNTNEIPVWNGDKGQFEAIDSFKASKGIIEILNPDATGQRLAN